MKQPETYNPVIHSFLNACTGAGMKRNNVIRLLKTNFHYIDKSNSQRECFEFYAYINMNRRRPSDLHSLTKGLPTL